MTGPQDNSTRRARRASLKVEHAQAQGQQIRQDLKNVVNDVRYNPAGLDEAGAKLIGHAMGKDIHVPVSGPTVLPPEMSDAQKIAANTEILKSNLPGSAKLNSKVLFDHSTAPSHPGQLTAFEQGMAAATMLSRGNIDFKGSDLKDIKVGVRPDGLMDVTLPKTIDAPKFAAWVGQDLGAFRPQAEPLNDGSGRNKVTVRRDVLGDAPADTLSKLAATKPDVIRTLQHLETPSEKLSSTKAGAQSSGATPRLPKHGM